MTRLTDEELEQWASGGNPIIERMAREIQERRAQDREFARLANVCRGYYHRNVAWPRDGVRNLLDTIDELLEANER